MATSNSSVTGESNTAKQASLHSERAMGRRRINVEMVQSMLLIWLDANIDEENNADCQNIITQLQRVMNSGNTFTNGDECVEFLETIDSDNNKASIIISGSLGQHVVSCVHNMSQVDSIFIFCSNKQHHQQWAKDWPKIKGVFTEIPPICEALKAAAQECEHNVIQMSFMTTDSSGDDAQKKLD